MSQERSATLSMISIENNLIDELHICSHIVQEFIIIIISIYSRTNIFSITRTIINKYNPFSTANALSEDVQYVEMPIVECFTTPIILTEIKFAFIFTKFSEVRPLCFVNEWRIILFQHIFIFI